LLLFNDVVSQTKALGRADVNLGEGNVWYCHPRLTTCRIGTILPSTTEKTSFPRPHRVSFLQSEEMNEGYH
jgi:hypothetical protein